MDLFAKRLLLLLLIIGGVSFTANAQKIPNDLSNVKVKQLSDSQVKKLSKKLEASGKSESEVKKEAKHRGMSDTQISQLQRRIKSLDEKNVEKGQNGQKADTSNSFGYNRTRDSLRNERMRDSIYGMSLFSGARPQFTPNLNIATPITYTIGRGDQINIDLYGDSEVSHELTVNREGKIDIPYVGSVFVSGMSIQGLRSKLKSRMGNVYKGLQNGRTNIEVNLGEVRSVQVILSGEVRAPGTYTLPALATVYNALYAAGGPTKIGDLREIEVYRDDSLLTTMDVYDFLQTGKLKGNETLKDQDVIKVKPYNKRVKITGQVKREMYFDLKKGETFDDLMDYVGGFTEKAYKSRIEVVRYTDKEKKAIDLLDSQFSQFQPRDGDEFTVSKILDRFENRVQLFGAVFKPGTYELTKDLTLSMLIKKADGLKEDAYTKLGYIDRLKPNLEVERISFNVADVMAGVEDDIKLQREDKVYISSIFDLRDEFKVRIEGEVRNPGVYDYSEGMKIDELIVEAGGFTESASSKRIEVSRRMRGGRVDTTKAADVFHVDLTKNLDYVNGDSVELKPFDQVVIRPEPGYESQKNVRIEGEVKYPGIYTIESHDERVSDIVKRAGGLNSRAYAKGASLKREGHMKAPGNFEKKSESERFKEEQEEAEDSLSQQRVQKMQGSLQPGDSTQTRSKIANNYVGVHLEKVLENPESADNIFLEDGDVLYVPRELQTVKVSGEVLSPVTTVFRKGQNFKEYISNAGGFTKQSIKRKAYIIYPDGSTKAASSFLGIKSYPKVEPGSEIFVPKRQPREPLSTRAIIGLGTSLASLAAMITAIFR